MRPRHARATAKAATFVLMLSVLLSLRQPLLAGLSASMLYVVDHRNDNKDNKGGGAWMRIKGYRYTGTSDLLEPKKASYIVYTTSVYY